MASLTAEGVRLRPITVAEYHRMGEAGILSPDERIQLVGGRIIEMPPTSPRHAYHVTQLYGVLRALFNDRTIVRTRQPLTLGSYSEPEPDIVLAAGPPERYEFSHPIAADAFLVIEVSDTTLLTDRREKLAVYAERGVREYWIVNLVDLVLEVFTDPDGAAFRERRVARPGERIAPRAFPDDALAVDAIFGARGLGSGRDEGPSTSSG